MATQNFYDKDSGLMSGLMMRAATPMGEIPVTITLSDYQEFGGVKVPATAVTAVMMQTQKLTTKTVEWNTVDAKVFELPAEIKGLKDAAAKPADAKPAAPAAPATGKDSK